MDRLKALGEVRSGRCADGAVGNVHQPAALSLDNAEARGGGAWVKS